MSDKSRAAIAAREQAKAPKPPKKSQPKAEDVPEVTGP